MKREFFLLRLGGLGLAALSLSLSLSLVACSSSTAAIGSSSTDGTDGGAANDSAAATGAMDDGSSPLATLDTPCASASGPTARQLLTKLGAQRTSTLTPFDGAGPVGPNGAVTRPHAPTALTIGIQYGGGAIRCFPPRLSCTCDPGPNGCPPCTADSPRASTSAVAVAVDVTLSFSTADGSYRESFVSSVRSDDLGFSGSVAGAAFKGTYPISLGATKSDVTMSFSGSFHDTGTHGGISETTAMISFGAATW